MSADTQPVIRLRHTLFCELTQREERGNWFSLEDLPGTRIGRPALKRALMPYIDNVMAQLLGTTPMSHHLGRYHHCAVPRPKKSASITPAFM